MKAGICRKDITPPKGLELAGYPHYPRYNTGFHDPLYATCLYVNSKGKEVALITLDILFFSKKHVLEVREELEKQKIIDGKNVMISCSHTHSGPWASGRLDIESLEAGREEPHEYVKFLCDSIVEIIKNAKENAFDAEITYGTAVCGAESGIGGNRRVKGGPHDPLVSVIAVRDMDKKVRGMMVNYTLHPTFIHEWSTVCTADYPCYLKLQLEELEKGAIVGFSQGASGNQSSRYYRKGESYDEAERVGRTLGKAAHTVLDNAVWESEPEIKTATKEVELLLRNFGTEEELRAKVAEDEKVYNELNAKYKDTTDRKEYYMLQNANLKLLGSEDQLGYILMQKRGIKISLLEDEAPCEIQSIKIGGLLIVGFPGEVFVEYGLYIKATAGFGTVIVNELSNGVLPGYLYTPESLVTGGYETDTSMLSAEFGKKFMDGIFETIENVK